NARGTNTSRLPDLPEQPLRVVLGLSLSEYRLTNQTVHRIRLEHSLVDERHSTVFDSDVTAELMQPAPQARRTTRSHRGLARHEGTLTDRLSARKGRDQPATLIVRPSNAGAIPCGSSASRSAWRL